MIDAKELRIGNYVNPCHNNNSLGVIVPITGIIARIFTIEFFKCKLANDIELSFAEQECYDYEFNMIEPIPITEEWLLKLGFKIEETENKRSKKVSNSECSFYINYFGEYVFLDLINRTAKIKYIHQLQNIYFAVTEQELTIQ